MGAVRGAAAIVGIGTAGRSEAPGWSSLELLAQAAAAALDDAGLSLPEVDGLCAGTLYHFFPTLSVGEYLGIQPRWSDSDSIGGASFLSHIGTAARALEAGLCDVALVAYGSNARSSRNLGGLIEMPEFERPYAPAVPIAGYALAAARHMHQYGTTREHLAEVVVAARRWAQRNPAAQLRDPITIADALAAPMVADPFTKHDCCLVSDGAAAAVMVRADRARDARRAPAFILGSAGAHWHREIAQMPDLTVTAASSCGPRAFAQAGISPSDVDVLQLYDAFSINPILFLEDLGFCAKGEGGPFVSGGRIAPGGDLPVNTNGGGLAYIHPGMYSLFGVVEAVEQLRGAAGDRQVPAAQIAVVHGNGGTLSSQFTAVFGIGATL